MELFKPIAVLVFACGVLFAQTTDTVNLNVNSAAGTPGTVKLYDSSNPNTIAGTLFGNLVSGIKITSGSYLSGSAWFPTDTQAMELIIPDTELDVYYNSSLDPITPTPFVPTKIASLTNTLLTNTGGITTTEFHLQTTPAYSLLAYGGTPTLMNINTDGSILLGPGPTSTSPGLYFKNSVSDIWQIQATNTGTQSLLTLNQIVALNPEFDIASPITVGILGKLLVPVEVDIGTGTEQWDVTTSTISAGFGCPVGACDVLLLTSNVGATSPTLEVTGGLYLNGGQMAVTGAGFIGGNLSVGGTTVLFSGAPFVSGGAMCLDTSGFLVVGTCDLASTIVSNTFSALQTFSAGIDITGGGITGVVGSSDFSGAMTIHSTLNVTSTFSLGAGTHIVYICNIAGVILPAGTLTTVASDCGVGGATDSSMRTP
jgi:hypothetical protein